MKIDVAECERQRRKHILKNEKYIRLEVIIGEELEPYCYLESKNSNVKNAAVLIRTLEDVIKTLHERTPFLDVALKGIISKGAEVYHDGDVKEIKSKGIE